MDKTIFFGYTKTMTNERKKTTENFLKDKCGVKEVKFYPVNEYNLEQILEEIEDVLKAEQEKENACYFDLTGGEDLVLVAIGMLAQKHQIPIHKYDVEKNLLIGFHRDNSIKINKTVPKQKIVLNLDDIIRMQGGCINYKDQKAYKDDLENEIFKNDIMKMWEVARKDAVKWNVFSGVLKELKKYESGRNIFEVSQKEWEKVVDAKKEALSEAEIEGYFNALQRIRIVTWNKRDGNGIEFSYKSDVIKDCLLDAGCLLELSTYYDRKNSGRYTDVRVGIHLDWDGKITYKGKDVENEIDVMTLEGNIPTFISCKNGEVSPTALYELDTIAEALGGKYAKKELVIGATIAWVQQERAKRMDIVVSNGCV